MIFVSLLAFNTKSNVLLNLALVLSHGVRQTGRQRTHSTATAIIGDLIREVVALIVGCKNCKASHLSQEAQIVPESD